HGAFQVGAEDGDGSVNARFSCGGETIGVGASEQDGARAHADCLDDVAAAAHASVHQDFDLAVHGLYNFRQNAQGCGNAVQLAASVIGDDNAGGSDIDRTAGIVAGEDA